MFPSLKSKWGHWEQTVCAVFVCVYVAGQLTTSSLAYVRGPRCNEACPFAQAGAAF